MRKTLTAFGLVAFVALGALTASAGDKCCAQSGKAKMTGACSASACDAGKCMPKMVMMVGDESFECPHAAQTAADKSGKKVVYAVGKQQFECKDKAMAAYADVMDEFVVQFASVRTQEECMAKCSAPCGADKAAKAAGCCSGHKDKAAAVAATDAKAGADCSGHKAVAVADAKAAPAGKFCVAGRCYETKAEAEKTAKMVSAAMEKVTMAYRVDGKNYCCDKMAGAACQKSGKSMTYVVGETDTPCKVTARIELDKAKVAAAAKALEEQKVASKV